MVHATTVSDAPVRLAGRLLSPEITQVLGDLRGRVDGDVMALSFDHEGNVLSIEDGGVLRQWDPKRGNLIQSVTLSEVETCWAFSHDGRYVASGSTGLTIWNTSEGELLGRHEDRTWMTSLAFSPDSTLLASGHDDFKIRIWNARNGRLIHVLTGHTDEISAIAFSADGKRLATAAEDRLVYIWDVKLGHTISKLEGHTDRVDDLAWSPTGHRIASAGWDTSVRVWDPKKSELLALLNGQGECVHAVEFTPDGKWIVCADSNGFVRIWDYANLKIKGEIKAHVSAARHIAIRPDGKEVVSGGTDRALRFIKVPSAEPMIDVESQRTTIVSLAPTKQGEAAIVHGEGTLTAWGLRKGNEIGQGLPNQTVLSVASTPDGRVVAGTMSGHIAIFDDVTESPTRIWQGQTAPVKLVAFRPDGREIATSASVDGTVRIWNPEDGEPTLIIPLAIGEGTVEAIAYHPTLPILAAAGVRLGLGADGAIKLWNTETIQLERSFSTGATAVCFSPNGRHIAAATLQNMVLIWDIQNGKVAANIECSDASINAIAFDPAGEFFVVGGDDTGIRVWETKRWRMTASFDIDTRIKFLSFTADGKQLITGNSNSAAYVIGRESLR